MQVEWYGQSAFRLAADGTTVVIDPFADMSAMAGSRGLQFDYPPIAGVQADLLLVTHEHPDHNGVEAIEGEPVTLRSTAGRLDSPIGEVVGVASEHDEQAGTERGPNTIFVFELDGTRVAHFGDFGQSALREEQARAIGPVDLLIVPVGGGPTVGAEGAKAIVERLKPRWVVPMHYRTPRIGFLETADAFLEGYPHVERLTESVFETDHLPAQRGRSWSPRARPEAEGPEAPRERSGVGRRATAAWPFRLSGFPWRAGVRSRFGASRAGAARGRGVVRRRASGPEQGARSRLGADPRAAGDRAARASGQETVPPVALSRLTPASVRLPGRHPAWPGRTKVRPRWQSRGSARSGATPRGDTPRRDAPPHAVRPGRRAAPRRSRSRAWPRS